MKNRDIKKLMKELGINEFNIQESSQYVLIYIKTDDYKEVEKKLSRIATLFGISKEALIFYPVIKARYSAIAIPKPENEWTVVPFKKPNGSGSGNITYYIGQDIMGNDVVSSTHDTPHHIIYGTTNSGKTTILRAMVLSALCSPVKPLVTLIDPKDTNRFMKQFVSAYITDRAGAVSALERACNVGELRVQLLAKCGVDNIAELNSKSEQFAPYIEKYKSVYPDQITPDGKLRELVIVHDEWKDFIRAQSSEKTFKMSLPNDDPEKYTLLTHEANAEYIDRIAYKYRAIGIYLVLVSQYINSSIVDSTTLSNIGGKIVCLMNSQIESDTVLRVPARPGAHKIPPKGGFLYKDDISTQVRYGRGCYIGKEEFIKILSVKG